MVLLQRKCLFKRAYFDAMSNYHKSPIRLDPGIYFNIHQGQFSKIQTLNTNFNTRKTQMLLMFIHWGNNLLYLVLDAVPAQY